MVGAYLTQLSYWLHSEDLLAQAHIEPYYGWRMMQRALWKMLLRAKVRVTGSLRGLLRNAIGGGSRRTAIIGRTRSRIDRMGQRMKCFFGRALLILIGQDGHRGNSSMPLAPMALGRG